MPAPTSPCPKARDRLPNQALPAPKASVQPMLAQASVTTAAAAMVWATMDSAFFVRSMPP